MSLTSHFDFSRLVNMHAVITDTQRSITQVQSEVNKLLDEDVDHRALVSLRLLTCSSRQHQPNLDATEA